MIEVRIALCRLQRYVRGGAIGGGGGELTIAIEKQ